MGDEDPDARTTIDFAPFGLKNGAPRIRLSGKGCFPWGCIGNVFAAFITGICLILSVVLKAPGPNGTSQPILFFVLTSLTNSVSISVSNTPTSVPSTTALPTPTNTPSMGIVDSATPVATIVTATPLPTILTATPTTGPVTNTATPKPHASATEKPLATSQNVIFNCPQYQETGKGESLTMHINVPSGEIAFVDAWGFDGKSGGVFVTITGPYEGDHIIMDGALCEGIPINSNYTPVKQQRIQQLRTPYQNLFLPTLETDTATSLMPQYSIDEVDYSGSSLNEQISSNTIVCLTTGPIKVDNATPPINFPGDGRASVVCWDGPQHVQASGLASSSSLKRITVMAGDLTSIASSLVIQWGKDMTTHSDACGKDYGPCKGADLAVILPDGSVIRPELNTSP